MFFALGMIYLRHSLIALTIKLGTIKLLSASGSNLTLLIFLIGSGRNNAQELKSSNKINNRTCFMARLFENNEGFTMAVVKLLKLSSLKKIALDLTSKRMTLKN